MSATENSLVMLSSSDSSQACVEDFLPLTSSEVRLDLSESEDNANNSLDRAEEITDTSLSLDKDDSLVQHFGMENHISPDMCGVTSPNMFEASCNSEKPDSLPASLIRLLPEIPQSSVQPDFQEDKDLSSKKKTHLCDVCNKDFSQKYLLKIHYRTHTGDKPYKCTVCDRSFSQYSGLRTHNMIHTGERPYKCDICDKGFTQSSTLTIHYRKHTGNKPFPCDICGRAFAYSCAMKKHRTIHTGEKPYVCDVCGKHFSRSGNLKAHSRIHSGDTPYECPTCGKKFKQRSNMYTHLKTHSDIKNYACQMCGREFHTKFNLQRHLILTHAPKRTK